VEDFSMRFLAALAALLMAALPAGAQTVLRYAPTGDLRILDPIWTSAAITLTHAQLIYDVLVTADADLKPQLQMAESAERSADGMSWIFTLRPGLAFHDGSPVTAEDVALSLTRWGKRVTAGQAMLARSSGITALDARRLQISFNRPFGPVLESLSSPVLAPFVMRASEARVDAFEQVKTVIGSGPYIFVPEGFRPGNASVYRRNAAYKPRSEPSSGYAGAKITHFDRIEWLYLPDQSTAVQALLKGEIDFLDSVQADLVPLLKRDKNIQLQVLNTTGAIGTVRPNTLVPPFNDPRARQALLLLMDQEAVAATVAVGPELARTCYALFVCGTPYETQAGLSEWKSPDLPRAKKLLADAGYKGERIVLLDPADQPDIHALALLTADGLRRIGANVDVQTMDWSTVLTRRNTRESPATNPNGWNLAFTFWGGFSLASPVTNSPLVSSCDGKNLYGWPCDAEIERLRSAFLDAPDLAGQMRMAEAIQRRFLETVPYVPTGIIQRPVAHRADLKDLPKTLYPVFWGIRR
jgi:peptide/nickel transport system substrate-binding protein